MDYIDGVSLDIHLADKALTQQTKLELFCKICEAVGAAHLCGIIHRDLKPSNIRVDEDGQPHVLDFGLAKTPDDDLDLQQTIHSMTMTGQFVGSLPWASPEQADGRPDHIDVRTDVYALGVILFQTLTGRFPYPVVGHVRDVVDNIISKEPVRPSTISSDIDNDLETIVLKALSKEPQRRYAGTVELSQDIQRYLAGEPIEAKRDSSLYVLGKSLRRHRTAVGVVSAFIFLLGAFGVYMSVQYANSKRQAARTKQTLSFLQDTLFEASSHRLGVNATMLDLLQEASSRLDGQFTDQPEVAAALHYTIGHAYDTIWKPTESLGHLRTALNLSTETYGREHQETVRTMVLLGMVMAELRDPESIELQSEALVIRQNQLGEKHFLVGQSRAELAYAMMRSAIPRNWPETERLFKEAETYYRTHHIEPHQDFARYLHSYAAMFHILGRYEEADSIYHESLSMSESILGPDHQFVTECKRDYSVVLSKLGRYDEALQLMDDVLINAPKQFGSANLSRMQRRVAAIHLEKGDLAETQRWLDMASISHCRQLAIDHPDERDRIHTLANTIEANSGKIDLDVYLETFETITTFETSKWEALENYLELGRLMMAKGTQDDLLNANKLLELALAIFPADQNKMTLSRAYVATIYGECRTRLGHFEKAESQLLDAHEFLVSQLGTTHPTTRLAAGNLHKLYTSWNKPDNAELFQSTE